LVHLDGHSKEHLTAYQLAYEPHSRLDMIEDIRMLWFQDHLHPKGADMLRSSTSKSISGYDTNESTIMRPHSPSKNQDQTDATSGFRALPVTRDHRETCVLRMSLCHDCEPEAHHLITPSRSKRIGPARAHFQEEHISIMPEPP
jgi:hypothetical protein